MRVSCASVGAVRFTTKQSTVLEARHGGSASNWSRETQQAGDHLFAARQRLYLGSDWAGRKDKSVAAHPALSEYRRFSKLPPLKEQVPYAAAPRHTVFAHGPLLRHSRLVLRSPAVRTFGFVCTSFRAGDWTGARRGFKKRSTANRRTFIRVLALMRSSEPSTLKKAALVINLLFPGIPRFFTIPRVFSSLRRTSAFRNFPTAKSSMAYCVRYPHPIRRGCCGRYAFFPASRCAIWR